MVVFLKNDQQVQKFFYGNIISIVSSQISSFRLINFQIDEQSKNDGTPRTGTSIVRAKEKRMLTNIYILYILLFHMHIYYYHITSYKRLVSFEGFIFNLDNFQLVPEFIDKSDGKRSTVDPHSKLMVCLF